MMDRPRSRAFLAVALLGGVALGSGCAQRSATSGPTAPASRARRAVEALERDAFAAARYELYWLAARCEAGDVGRRALLLLAATELDPNNPYGSVNAAAHAAASYLLLPDAEAEQVPLARSLYRIAVDLGAPTETPESEVRLSEAQLAGRYDTCASGTSVIETRALPRAPETTRANRTRALEASLHARDDSLHAMRLLADSSQARIAELEAEIERITALLREGTPRSSTRGGR